MELLERYLQAVKFWLPKKQQDDILAELKEDIASEIEEKETGLGRKMTGAEIEALLKKRGRPMMVAMRFRPKGYLIGPTLYPMYTLVLKIAILCYVVPWALAGLVLLFFGSSHPLGEVVGGLWGSLWGTLAFQFSIITLVFAALEQCNAKGGYLENWNPGALPKVRPARDPYRVARTGSLVEIVMSLIFLAWWIKMPQGFPFAWGLDKAGIHWAWGSVWQDFHHHFFYLVIVLTLINVCVAVVNLIRPYWTRPTLVIRGTINASVATMAYFVVRAHWPEMKSEWILLTGTHPAVAQAEMLSRWTNLSIYSALAISTVVAGIQALVEYVRAILWRNSGSKLKAAAALVLVAASLGASGTKAFPTEGTTRNTAYSAQLAKMSLPAFTGEAALSVRKDFEITFTFETNESWRVKLEFQPDCEAHGFLGRFLSGLNRVI
ncbi:MAG TPA: hypothetical protein VLV88_05090 [Terriglobales bacterium]|nr:hypothetical protein [Terriglobales bacterium]